MPPWVARQWHVGRCSRSICGSLSRSQPHRRAINIRFYTQRSAQDGSQFRLQTANSAVIIPSSVANTRPADLVAHITPVSKARVFYDRFAVFFVTPSFATWLLDDSAFLHKALRQAYAEALGQSTYTRIHALCAVVDRLPGARPIANADDMMNEGFERIRSPSVAETGHEGIAYATLLFSDSIPTSSAHDEVTAAISFVGAKGSGEEGGHFSDAVRLPLANTVFQTGSTTTMTYSTWVKDKGSDDLELKEKQHVSHHGVRMQLDAANYSTTLSVPLVPLSLPRQVESSMGNILRSLIGPGGESITASQELERIVPRYFGARGEPSQATTVWALVMDRDNVVEALEGTNFLLDESKTQAPSDTPEDKPDDELWENLWKKDPPFWNPLIPIALKSGARLHRVLSGGGGWGKKAGLLSLDPLPVAPSKGQSDFDDFDDFDGPGELSDALQQVANDGDYIQFFISPSVPRNDGTLVNNSPDQNVWGLELGTIPSTSDSMPAVPPTTETAKNEVTVYRNTFGALVEGGMVISRSFKLQPRDSFSLIGGTTIDVPFSRFSAVNWVTCFGEDEDVDVGASEKHL
ncbi:hypothetical protein BU23DRAFT_158989 [Bimuria novae-zelandiae CBS 107.79]|uniref:Uncharacterized protein n=1 Tax=Bimuria novae-zelandiae CBS 107.79 TaxID=1447943 RepID=A0A6A5V8U9_9PLEO|nr:hypothetical protein BU23DRAFT_158989 [Bimuria novae-zelandiae CBS 107.79]